MLCSVHAHTPVVANKIAFRTRRRRRRRRRRQMLIRVNVIAMADASERQQTSAWKPNGAVARHKKKRYDRSYKHVLHWTPRTISLVYPHIVVAMYSVTANSICFHVKHVILIANNVPNIRSHRKFDGTFQVLPLKSGVVKNLKRQLSPVHNSDPGAYASQSPCLIAFLQQKPFPFYSMTVYHTPAVPPAYKLIVNELRLDDEQKLFSLFCKHWKSGVGLIHS